MTTSRCLSIAVIGALLATPLYAQTGSVRGRVVDAATQAPLSGVTISAGTRFATSQDDGRYLVEGIASGVHTLRARLVGYAPLAQPVNISAGTTVEANLALTAQAIGLAEIIVTGYGETNAGNITGAVTQLTTNEFNTGRIVNATELIQNKAAGVQVVESNEPGGGTSVRIRGTTSINASSEPLYVIDGVPLGTGAGGGLSAGRDPLNFLNPNDIETITVLRDASAAAIYGANAASGVILITTKQGRTGPQFEYTASVSTSSITRRPSMLNAAQFRTAVTDHQGGTGNLAELLNENTDWYGLVTRNGTGTDHNLAVSGTGTSSSYRLSLGWLDQSGIVRGTELERLSIGANYQQRLMNDRVSVRANLRGSRAVDGFTPGGVLSNAAQMGPTQPVFDPATTTGYYDWPGGLQSPDNPIAILDLATDRGTTLRSIGNLQLEYQLPFLQGLAANVDVGYDVTKADRDQFRPSTLHREVVGTQGSFLRRNHTQLNTLFETYLNYEVPQALGPGQLDLTAGYSWSGSRGDFPEVSGTDLSTDLLGPNGDPAAAVLQNRMSVQESRLISFFGRVNYNVNDRYLAALTIRRDGSSRFGPENQWGTFPALSVAWRLSEEGFFRGRMNISDLKLRASVATTGNQNFENYVQFSRYQVGDAQSTYFFDGVDVVTIRPSPATPGIRWEETRSTNIGLDYGFANQRFTGSIDWYRKNTNDLIFTVPAAAGKNLSNFETTNIGSMRNTGIELSLSARILEGQRRGGLSWTADFTASHNSNELTSINPNSIGNSSQILVGGVSGGVGTLIQVLRPGEPVNSFFVYEHRRNADGSPVFATGAGADTAMYVDQNGDNIINQSDRRPFHDPAPKWILGHSSYLNYGRFDFGFTLRAYMGNYVYNNVASNLGSYEEVRRGSPFNLHTSVLETDFDSPQYLSDYYVEDASFLRMDNLTLGYTFNWRGQPARIYGSVQNAFTMTGYSGVDPTAGLNGLDNNIYPRSRTFSAGATVRF